MNLRDLLRELRIPFREFGQHHHVRQNNLGLDCPSCSPNAHRFRLGVHVDRLVCNCWVCGRKWLPEVLAAASGTPVRTVLAMLPAFASVSPVVDDRPRGKFTPPDGATSMLRCHRDYLARRRIDPDYAALVWGVGGIGLTAHLKWRLYLPVICDSSPVSWTTRAVGDRVGLRYVSATPEHESVPLKETLYGEHLAGGSVVVCEGPLDAVRVGTGAVATYGLTVTKAQLWRLARYARVAVAFDAEPAAQRRARQICSQLECFGGVVSNILLETGKDPADASDQEVRELRNRFLE